MDELEIERLGGLANFGPGSHVRSRGRVDFQRLSDADKAKVERLFSEGGGPPEPGADAFRYRVTRQTSSGPEAIEAAANSLPAALIDSVQDELD